MTTEQSVAAAMALSEEELFTLLGRALVGPGDVGRDGSEEDLNQRGHNWLERNWQALRDLLCNGTAKAIADRDDLVDAATIADIIGDHLIKAPGAITVTAILYKRGLGKLCADS